MKTTPVNFSFGERALACSLLFTFNQDSLISVHFSPGEGGDVFLSGPDSFAKPLAMWLEDYSKGVHGQIPFPLSMDGLTPFTQKVLTEMGKIPFGETQTYGDLAKACGGKNFARAVGGACNRNPFPLLFPCHRVVGAGGSIGGFAYGGKVKEALLTFEKNSRVS